ncbi:hypothetical protein ETU08_05125 [Apibacter muscae]|uniref:DNA polymerase III subunit gamma/tau n=1 Tax=Apibacter muscae TaxID=2509004 RepID=A0A563DF11_9FLAO|nr:hypothetical protein [Apibacter muscae]TWP28805.1 hypothetical protein ETU09_05680 [Apibacter muscae]TWP29944.1 hypothetical protein ETU08_05125 [Apibacter muscae]
MSNTNSLLSIKNILETTEEKIDKNLSLDTTQKPKDEFNEEQVILFWNDYLEKLKLEEPILFNALNSAKCNLKDKYLISFEFPSNSSYEEFETLREDFFQKLKYKLNNFSIEFTYQIKQSTVNISLSEKDKYQKMLKENPWLEKLRNDFRLDF